MKRAAFAAALLALLLPGRADAARYAIGVDRGVSFADVAAEVERRTCGAVSRELESLRALLVTAPSVRGVASIPGVAYVERLGARRPAFTPRDPLAPRQWHLAATRAFEAWPEYPPSLAGVRVAVIDSGIDAEHPEFAGRIAETRSFVRGSARVDQHGHGTFIAGIIAANLNDEGIAGMAFPAQLLVGKVVRGDGSIPLEAEAKAIRWAADRGAAVINLSLGGLRDPIDPRRDTYSPLEASAVAYAYSKGAVLVAPTGNSDQAPRRPWNYASYPAALPHVIGVSALSRDGSVPTFSDRDEIYNDVAAPGQDLFSTFPRQLTAARPACQLQGYSECGPDEYRRAEGTSFAAPQVAAAAALVLAVKPTLGPDQVAALLTRTAVDANASNGCRRCPLLRDALSGWGRLNVLSAVLQAQSGKVPAADQLETNDDAGTAARKLWGARKALVATLDFWDDQSDVYAVRLRAGERLTASVVGPRRTDTNLLLWRPGTRRVEGLSPAVQRMRLKHSAGPGPRARVVYTVPAGAGGWHYLHVKIVSPGAGQYTLRYEKRLLRRE